MIRGKAALRSGWYTESYVARALLNHVAHVSALPFPAGVRPLKRPPTRSLGSGDLFQSRKLWTDMGWLVSVQ